ncbi:MAG: DUF1565 domain-containing protein, partial [Acidobacteriaceae bacterium]
MPADAPTIQQAIDQASAGDTVLIASGTYHENIDFLGKAITVEGSGKPSATILDGGGDTVVAIHHGEGRSSILENLTVQNGAPITWQGGGIYISGASPTIQDDIIQNNIGCGIGAYNSAPLISGNVVSGTTEPLTEGIYPIGKFPCTDPSGEADINTAEGTGIFVYGISTEGLVTEILGNTVTGNIGSPAAMYLADSGVA